MTAKDRSIRLQIMLDGVEVAALEDWRFKRRMPADRKSADFGVVETLADD